MRKHLTYANVMSTLAALFALSGGVAYAANTVFSSDIVDGEVKEADIGTAAVREAEIGQGAVAAAELKNDAVTAQKVLNETLAGGDVADNALKGADIDESTLSGIGGGGPAGGDLTGTYPNPEIRADRVGSSEVAPDSLTGAEIADQSGVDTCTHGTVRYGELCARSDTTSGTWLNAQDQCSALELRLPSLGEAQALAEHHSLPNVGTGDKFWTEEFYRDGVDDFRAWIVSGAGVRGTIAITAAVDVVCVTTPTN